MGSSLSDLMEVVALAEAGRIKLQTERFPLEKAPEAYASLKANKLRGAR